MELYGERDINLKDNFIAVRRKLAQAFVVAVITACALFGLIYYIGTDYLEYYFGTSMFINKKQEPYIEEFQKYVSANNVKTDDIEKYDDWRNADMYNVPVKFADKEANVFIYAGFTEKYYISLWIADIGISFFLGFFIVFRSMSKVIKKFQRDVYKAGQDEQKAREEKDYLMRNMAHDLRTPLTGLMTYIDILKLEAESGKINREHLDIAESKVLELRELTDQLFDFSLASSDENIQMDELAEVEYAIGDYLSEMYMVITESGYSVNIENIKWKKEYIAVNSSLVSRVFNNITSNICKYADISKPVFMEIKYKQKVIEIKISNAICEEKKLLDSAGIGLKNVELMMKRMNGFMTYADDNGMFTVKLHFPVAEKT